MNIALNSIGKRFNYTWIFRNLTQTLETNNAYAVLGGNGSGKSTLLKVLAGVALPSEGTIKHSLDSQPIEPSKLYLYFSLCTPYQSLINDFSFEESIAYQAQFKPFVNNLQVKDIVELSNLTKIGSKPLKYFSSGMQQRAKLTLAVLANTPLLLLDEPTSNLDKQGITWYQNLVNTYRADRLVVVCSNRFDDECSFCNHQIEIENFKK